MSYFAGSRRCALPGSTGACAALLLFVLTGAGTFACADGGTKGAAPFAPDHDAIASVGDAAVQSGATHAGRADAETLSRGVTGHGADGAVGAGTCARAELTTSRVIPTVWMLIDGSGSMAAPLNGLTGDSRWQVLRDALLAEPDGLIARLQGSVDFGLFVYDGGLSPPGIKTDACPRTVEVAPALNNLAALSAAYPELQTGASTPTHYALEVIRARIAAAAQTAPTYVVLATDGRPNLCDFHDGLPSSPDTEQDALDTVSALAALGTKVFSISLAGDDPELTAHLNAVALAGNTGTAAFSPTTQGGLVDALAQIVGGTTSCSVHVEGSIVAGRECMGDVRLNGQPLACNAADGFRVGEDRKTLELTGTACEALRLQANAELSASFACDDVIVI